MQTVPASDPRLSHVYPGVMQTHDGQLYRQGMFEDGSVAFVAAEDGRKFEYVPSSMANKTDYFKVTDHDGEVSIR